jgi:integrase
MPRLVNSPPRYRKHKASGRAIVTIEGKDIALGRWNFRSSRIEYNQVISEYFAAGRHLPPNVTAGDITVGEIIERFWDHVQVYYRRTDGTPTSEICLFKSALDPVNQIYGHIRACDFGPLSLESVRDAMIEKDWCRRTINKAVGRVREMFRWAVAKELIPALILEALKSVIGLRAGRTRARETPPVQPVSDEVVNATLPFMSRTVRAMVQLQRLAGARPGEICAMRTGDIDPSKTPWEYVPRSHKNSYRGQTRTIPLGPNARQILNPFLRLDPDAYCFSPAQAERERREAVHNKRKTPIRYGNRPGTNRRRKPKCAPGQCYTVNSYRAAIKRACELAFQPPPPLAKMQNESVRAWKRRLTPEQLVELRKWNAQSGWHPHQLRHSRGTQIRKDFGIEGTQAVLGHTSLGATQVYAQRSDDQARKIAEATG